MRRLVLIALACLASVALEVLVASASPVPLTSSYIGLLLQKKLDRARSIGDEPKIVLLAGSNGLFSHRCEVIGAMVGMPCVNGSIAVGIGLDYLFDRWRPVLHRGDVLYMPMEGPQYTRTRAENRVGPELDLMLHQDWRTLAAMPPDRQAAALFVLTLRGTVEEAITMAGRLVWPGNVRAELRHDFNAWGDRVGHTEAEAAGAHGGLDRLRGTEPDAAAIEAGYGTQLIGGFVRWASHHGMVVIGGLPTGFDDIAMPEATIAALRAVFTANGGRFLVLPDHSRYPRHDFFDTRYHLYEGCQIRHSILVADELARMLGRSALPPPPWAAAARCGDTPNAVAAGMPLEVN